MSERLRVGFVMNPIAGLGGRAGLKGSDDPDSLRPILKDLRFEDSYAYARAVEAFSFLPLTGGHVVSAPGILGAEALKATIGRGGPFLEVLRLGIPAKPFGSTGPEDTRRFVEALAKRDLDLLVFVGGDGTAIDVAQAARQRVPILGVPAGVKMFSGVFAQSPAMAREVLGRIARGFPTKSVDVVDLDESSYRDGTFNVRAHAMALTPEDPAVPFGKGGGTVPESEALEDLVAWFRQAMDPRATYIIGAGTTTWALKRSLGQGTPLGVDAYRGGRPAAIDANAETLERLLAGEGDVRVIVSPTGLQGCVLGRGTAQISPEVLRRAGVQNVIVVATPSKLNGVLELFVDTGDPRLDAEFPAYIKVRTDPLTEKMMRLRRAAAPARRARPSGG